MMFIYQVLFNEPIWWKITEEFPKKVYLEYLGEFNLVNPILYRILEHEFELIVPLGFDHKKQERNYMRVEESLVFETSNIVFCNFSDITKGRM